MVFADGALYCIIVASVDTPRLIIFDFIVLNTSLKTKNAPCFDDAFQCDLILLLCVADIHFKGAGSGLFIPNPNIRDVGIFGVWLHLL